MPSDAELQPTATAHVDLSQYHAGQIIEYAAYVEIRTVSRRENGRWREIPVSWRPVLVCTDRSIPKETRERGPWCASAGEAEDWLTGQGLRLAGGIAPKQSWNWL